MAHCSLFSNHGNVLLVLSEDPDARLRDVAAQVGITERAVQSIVRDLQAEGIVEVSRHGRRNRYRINARKSLRQPLAVNRTVGQLLGLMRESRPAPTETDAATEAAVSRRAPEPDPPSIPQAAPVSEVPTAPEAAPEQRPEPAGEKRQDSASNDVSPPEDPPATRPGSRRRARDDQQGSLF